MAFIGYSYDELKSFLLANKDRVKLISKKASAYELVDNAIKKKLGKVTKSDVAELCPSLSISAIEKAIAKMVEEGRLEKMGSGKTTYYVVKL